VSQVELRKAQQEAPGSKVTVKVEKAEGLKCERCWKFSTTVGSNPAHPTLCSGCCEAIADYAA
jgi:isoleucyl-tRNA synthetase